MCHHRLCQGVWDCRVSVWSALTHRYFYLIWLSKFPCRFWKSVTRHALKFHEGATDRILLPLSPWFSSWVHWRHAGQEDADGSHVPKVPRGWDTQHSPSHVSQPSRTWGFCTKSVPSVLPGMSQNFMSRFPTLTLTPNPHISACLPAGMARNTYSQTKPFSKEYCSESRLTSEICFLFFFLFFCCCYAKPCIRVTAYFAVPSHVSFTSAHIEVTRVSPG